ncbi:MAG: hypothetical protein ACJ76J_29880 [Thermoanaerobaculia bacterium]
MSRKGKKRPLPPRHKRMKRPARLQAARTWLAKYPGKNVVTGYKKHFAVDALCALTELQRLGVKLDPEYVQRVRSSEQSRIEARHRERERRKAAAVPAEVDGDSDERFAYIAGYTAWGFPYGVTWEEMEGSEGEPWGSNAIDMDCESPEDHDDCDEGIPF